MQNRKIINLGLRRLEGHFRESIYLKTGIDITKPETIRGMINQRCNYKCIYCYSWQRSEYPEISIAQWQTGLLSLKDYIGRYLILFSGGEPFLKKGFVDLLEFCHQNQIDWGVITNGTAFTPKNVQRVVAAKPLNIDISVDSPIAASNDFVRGATNSLQTIGKGIQRLCAERRHQNSKFLIRIKPTVTRKNYKHLPQMVDWAVQQGADTIDFAPVRPEPFWTEHTFADLWIPKEEQDILERVVSQLIDMKKSGAPIETATEKLHSLTQHFLMQQVFQGATPCRVGMRDFHISTTGDVNMCWEFPVIGNITTQTAKEIWESEIAQKIRKTTITCNKFSTISCANSCLSHRTLKQEAKRAIYAIKPIKIYPIT